MNMSSIHTDQVSSLDKIAEAEALAAEALRMANEAKRAAERLAEVKKTLAMFSAKLDKIEQVVLVEKKEVSSSEVVLSIETDDATPFETDKAAKEVAVVEEISVEEKILVEEKIVEKEIAEVAAKKTQSPTDAEKRVKFPSSVPEKTREVRLLVVANDAEKDPLEALLDGWGVDKMCGVEDEAILVNLVGQGGKPLKVRVITNKPEAPEKKEEIKPVEAREDEEQIVPKEALEEILDSWGLDKMCGIDDETLGIRGPPRKKPLPPAPPTPFENPTRVEVPEDIATPDEIIRTESRLEREANKLREKQNLPVKHYQKAPVNNDFTDPFGVDHDDFAMCGKIADLCEPDFRQLEIDQPRYLPMPSPASPKSILKKKSDAAEARTQKEVSACAESHVLKPEGDVRYLLPTGYPSR
jgi:hypothetical protein